MVKAVLCFTMLLVLTACSKLPFLGKPAVAEIPIETLCTEYFEEPGETLRARIDQLDLMAEGDWERVEEKRIEGGMSVCAMHAAWGEEHSRRDHESVLGPTTRYIFDRGGHHYAHINVKGGVVTSWSTLDRGQPERKRLFGFLPLPAL